MGWLVFKVHADFDQQVSPVQLLLCYGKLTGVLPRSLGTSCRREQL